MEKNMLDLYGRASEWTLEKVQGAATKLDDDTPCDEWDVRTLMNHMLDTQNYFVGTARGEKAHAVARSPGAAQRRPCRGLRTRPRRRRSARSASRVSSTRPARRSGIAFADQLLHGWDLAKATGQDTTMPKGLPEAAYEMIHGRFTDEQRKGVFKPEVSVPADASPQEKLLAYTGRDPD